MASPKYLVGIDLGTTNTVVAFCECGSDLSQCPIQLFSIDQLVGPGEVARRSTLPSFRYHPPAGQTDSTDFTLPWESRAVEGDSAGIVIGEWARELGSQVEGRQISSAKSWLSHPSVDRNEAILPWASAKDTLKVSPVTASASYLNHIRQCWNYHHPADRLEAQEIVITVPASFDESARKLTLEAAKLAGLNDVKLLEEPLAACYDWYTRLQDSVESQLRETPVILVCDVGGGTTDLSLITADFSDQGLKLNRVGVGEHLMLGGDNIDLSLAHLAEQTFQHQQKLNAARLNKLIQQTRNTKESLLASDAPDSAKITLLGSGSRLLGGAKSIELAREQVHQIALDGFFPQTSFDERPQQRQRAVVEFGLPYASDPAITRHIAAFLNQHTQITCQEDQSLVPVGLLLNGGVFNSDLIQQRLLKVLSGWSGQDVKLMDNPHPDLAVALGAVAYLKACRGSQLKIGGGAARSYFLHLENKNKPNQAICLLAKGTDENQEIRLSSRRFALTLGEPVRFSLLTTPHDRLRGHEMIQNGMLTTVDPDDFSPLPPYIASLDRRNDQEKLAANQKARVEVYLSSQLTPVGTLKIECVKTDDEKQRWQLEFEVRHQKVTDVTENLTSPQAEKAKDLITRLYSGNKNSADQKEIHSLNKTLERLLGKKDTWDSSVSRDLFDALAQGRKRRRRSELHEKNWFRLAGYTLRPGFGDPVDSWRIEQIWPLFQQGIQFKNHQGWSDWWIFWRRISGGLDQEQQESILAEIAKYLHPGAVHHLKQTKSSQDKSYEAMVRLAASLEHLETEDKILLTRWFLKRATSQTQYSQAHWWAVGRLTSRTLMYGSHHKVIPREQAEQWLPELLNQDWKQDTMAGFAAVMMCRKTGDRTLDITGSFRDDVIKKLQQSKAPESWLNLVSEVSVLDEKDSKRIFGDTLPTGLHLLQTS
ncbi:Chaperone protein DnaK [Vibrio aerogenes CECT 7868]|uniref:Chaperone protein DnaK n=1 Tax=Vibrio aerogenes CECT 7868 TaxID=1216006 RepID=A0A1M5Z8F4_9VIBR|nr:Hsp70 family protein [Vibrio aerogenes]SHI20378.1 Chaperone protein DnaK [Vibrio aerogenes CECT 7868]